MNEHTQYLTRDQLASIAFGAMDQELDSVWDDFSRPHGFGGIHHEWVTFADRRDGFLWTVEQLLEFGHIRLTWWSDASLVTGTPDEQVDIIRRAFPPDDDGMDDGRWFFSLESQVGAIWEWPGRDPKPFVD